MAKTEDTVKDALCNFLKKHSLEDSIGSVDDIVLNYVISILEDLGDSSNAEDNIDVDQFVEMMEAYIPGFGSLSSMEVYEWMFALSVNLTSAGSTDSDCKPVQLVDLSKYVPEQETVRDQTTDKNHSRKDSTKVEEEDASQSEDELRLLLEMFPASCSIEVSHCLSLATGNLEEAVQIILHRQDTGDSISSPHQVKEKTVQKTPLKDDQNLKDHVLARYSYVDEDDDKRVHKPLTPKREPKKLVRYLDGKVVSTKGERFTELKKPEDEEMKKTYVNLKPARKYRFH